MSMRLMACEAWDSGHGGGCVDLRIGVSSEIGSSEASAILRGVAAGLAKATGKGGLEGLIDAAASCPATPEEAGLALSMLAAQWAGMDPADARALLSGAGMIIDQVAEHLRRNN